METQNYTTEQRCAAMAALEAVLSAPDHKSGAVLHNPDGLGDENLKVLIGVGTLREVLDGWYVVCFAKEDSDPTDWYRAYWPFIVEYLNHLYPEEWCLSPDCSLDYYSADTLIPEELVIRSKFARGTVCELPFGTSLVEVRGDVPEDVLVEERFGVRLFPLHLALLKASEEKFNVPALEARTCLAKMTDPSDLIKAAKEEYYPERAMHLAGELRNIGRAEMADDIAGAVYEYMKGAEKLFSADSGKPVRLRQTGALGNRIRLMWRLMRQEVLLMKDSLDCRGCSRSVSEIILRLQDTLEHERPEIVNRTWNEMDIPGIRADYKAPEEESVVEDGTASELYKAIRKDLLLERGYRKAFRRVARDILDSLTGGNRVASLAALHYPDWNYVLFEPGVKEGLLRMPEDLWTRRSWEDSCIIGSRHATVDAAEIEDAVKALSELFQREVDPFVRAMLGHFFLIFIQPFRAGNIQTAWLLMNSQLVAAGYPWINLPEHCTGDYLNALKEAVELEHVDSLVDMLVKLINTCWKTDLRRLTEDCDYLDYGFNE